MYINMYIDILICVLTIIYINHYKPTTSKLDDRSSHPLSFAPAAVASARCKSHPHRHRRPRGPRGRPRSLRAVPIHGMLWGDSWGLIMVNVCFDVV